MKPFKPPPSASARAPSPRILPAFAPGSADPAEHIFVLALLHIRATVPSLAHHPLSELEVLFGDLRAAITEFVDGL